MDADEIAHKRKLLEDLHRRKNLREEQLALLGLNADPSIRIEIEDIEQEIQRIQQELHETSEQAGFQSTGLAIPLSTSERRSYRKHKNVFSQAYLFYRDYFQLHRELYQTLGGMYWLAVYISSLGAVIGAWRFELLKAYSLALAGLILGAFVGWVIDPASRGRIQQVYPRLSGIVMVGTLAGGLMGALVGIVIGSQSIINAVLWGLLAGILLGAIAAGVMIYNEEQ